MGTLGVTDKIILGLDGRYAKRYNCTMTYDHHPLMRHLDKTGETLTSFAFRCNISRQHLYRIMRGENTSIERLRALSEATGGKVKFNDFLMPKQIEAAQ